MNLSPAEWAVLAKVAEGKPNKVIARERGTSPATVHDQIESIFQKLGVANRVQAAIAYERSRI